MFLNDKKGRLSVEISTFETPLFCTQPRLFVENKGLDWSQKLNQRFKSQARQNQLIEKISAEHLVVAIDMIVPRKLNESGVQAHLLLASIHFFIQCHFYLLGSEEMSNIICFTGPFSLNHFATDSYEESFISATVSCMVLLSNQLNSIIGQIKESTEIS